ADAVVRKPPGSMQVKRKMSGGKSAHSFYSAPGIYHLLPIGVYTIMEVRSGKGSSAGWGRLKSGVGWINLDYVRKL
ncbi:N-acetylmuramoyl-L-alanine amidase, partial [Bacillota bacterium LCP21S3_D9]